MSKELQLIEDGALLNRAQAVSNQLVQIKNDTRKNFLLMSDLLLEAYEGGYHRAFGCTKFGDWVEQSDFDIGSRNAYYLVSIGQRINELGLDRSQLQEIPISKLKEILSLEPAAHAEDIKQLLGAADELTTDEIKEAVRGKKAKAGEEVYSHLNIKLPVLVKEIVEEAFELARRLHGSTVDQHGEIVDISDGKCLEFICATYLQDPNNFEQDGERGVFNAEAIQDEIRITQ